MLYFFIIIGMPKKAKNRKQNYTILIRCQRERAENIDIRRYKQKIHPWNKEKKMSTIRRGNTHESFIYCLTIQLFACEKYDDEVVGRKKIETGFHSSAAATKQQRRIIMEKEA